MHLCLKKCGTQAQELRGKLRLAIHQNNQMHVREDNQQQSRERGFVGRMLDNAGNVLYSILHEGYTMKNGLKSGLVELQL